MLVRLVRPVRLDRLVRLVRPVRLVRLSGIISDFDKGNKGGEEGGDFSSLLPSNSMNADGKTFPTGFRLKHESVMTKLIYYYIRANFDVVFVKIYLL